MYENLLNPNEFSSISGVSKQTLLFYEKKNVFKPIFKNEKGFRSEPQLPRHWHSEAQKALPVGSEIHG